MSPHRDKLSMRYEQMTSLRAIMMSGRIAEEMIFGKDKVTSGAQSDFEQATRLVQMIVTKWGFSPELSTFAYGENHDEVLLGVSMGRQQNISRATSHKIASEVRRLVEDVVNDARHILTEKQHEIEALARRALGYETLTGEEIRHFLNGQPPVRGSARPIAAWSLSRRANHSLTEGVCGPRTCLLEKLLGAKGRGHKRCRIQHEALH